MFLLSHNQVYGSGQEKEAVDDRWGVSPRYILQRVGTNLMRDQLAAAAPELSMGKDATLWVRCFRLWLGRFNTPQKVVVPDVRFEDEAAFIRELGGTLIRIVRPTGGGGVGGDAHASEQAHKDIKVDQTIVNDKSIMQLEVGVLHHAGSVNALPIGHLGFKPLQRKPQQPAWSAGMPREMERVRATLLGMVRAKTKKRGGAGGGEGRAKRRKVRLDGEGAAEGSER